MPDYKILFSYCSMLSYYLWAPSQFYTSLFSYELLLLGDKHRV